jgi:branched-chain amino acid transport system permease protein
MMIVALTAQGWNMLGGYGGLSSFGHAAFFGTGAYTTTILQTTFGINAWIGLACGVALGALVGAMIGFLSFRAGLKGSYFALITLAFAEVLRILANSWDFTGGAAGMMVSLKNGFWDLQFSDRRYFLLILVVFVALGLFLTRWLERSAFGAYLIALRENDQAAQALGVDIFRVKMQAITLSAAVTALAGSLYVQNFLFIDANVAYGSWISIEALFAAIVGGAGTIAGPLIGSVLLLGLGEITKSFSGGIAGIDLVVFGIILVLCVAFAPNGIRGFVADLYRRRTNRPPTVTKIV